MKKDPSFSVEVFKNSAISNFVSAVILWGYSMILISFPIKEYPLATFVGISLILVAESLFGPFTSMFLSRKVSQEFDFMKYSSSTEETRTSLISDLYKIPLKKMVETFIHFIFCASLYSLILYKFFHIDKILSIYFFLACFVASYVAMIFSYHNTSTLCSKKALIIAEYGINKEAIHNKKFFGTSMSSLFILYIIVPIIACSIIFFVIIKMTYSKVTLYSTGLIATRNYEAELLMNTIHKGYFTKKTQMTKIIFVILTNTVLLVYLAFLYFSKLSKMTLDMQKALINIKDNSSLKKEIFKVDFSSQMSYTMYLINEIVKIFAEISRNASDIDREIVYATQELATISEETSTTSVEQSATINDIISSMQKTDSFSQDILLRIKEVNKVAEKTTQDVNYGFLSVESNLNKMKEITASNESTLEGIKNLSEKISTVWDIVNLIDNVADLTKIIAFNAELEAGKIETENNNFTAVSNKIRELADNVMTLTGDVKKQISEIRESSSGLLVTGKDCMNKITEGNELTKSLEDKLLDIKKSSLNVSTATGNINEVITEQISLFKQLIQSMKEINESVSDYSEASLSVTKTVESLQDEAEHLKTLNSNLQGE